MNKISSISQYGAQVYDVDCAQQNSKALADFDHAARMEYFRKRFQHLSEFYPTSMENKKINKEK